MRIGSTSKTIEGLLPFFIHMRCLSQEAFSEYLSHIFQIKEITVEQ